MLESAREKGEEVVSNIRRSLSGRARADYIGYLIARERVDVANIEHQMANMNRRLAAAHSAVDVQTELDPEIRRAKLLDTATDEDAILGDELYQLRTGELSLDQEADSRNS